MIKHWNMVSSLTEMGSSPKIFRHKTGLIGLIGMIDLYNSSIFPRGQTIKIGFRPRKDGWSVVNIGNIHPSRGMIRIHKECETTEPHSELQIGPWEVRQYEPQKGLQHLTTSYRLPVEAKPVFGCFCCISVSDHQRPKALTLGNSR